MQQTLCSMESCCLWYGPPAQPNSCRYATVLHTFNRLAWILYVGLLVALACQGKQLRDN